MKNSARRHLLVQSGGLALAGLFLSPSLRPGQPPAVEIRTRSTADGARVWFDPVGVWIPSGTTVRWVNESNVHTATAYHPDNDNHSLRIPARAAPWDSGYLVDPGDSFEATLTVAGVYDYYCRPHEAAGMVGRIIVDRPDGPGTLPFDYFEGDATRAGWLPVPPAARSAFPAVETIMEQRVVRAG